MTTTRRRIATAAMAITVAMGAAAAQADHPRTYHFRIRTAGGGIVNTSQYAKDRYEAEYKIQKQYPGCTILSGN